jgi:hypothetical protein
VSRLIFAWFGIFCQRRYEKRRTSRRRVPSVI